MIQGTSAPLSALKAHGIALGVGANNIANASTPGFKRDRVIMTETPPVGVRATIAKDFSPGYQIPEHEGKGVHLVEMSNVDYGRELVDIMMVSRLYEANLRTLADQDELVGSLLDIKK
ncbi:MAG: flagellar basal body protein [Desulfobulbaceae bacterium]|nr:flagellar basal body protein [Desulfobulbaceae bacterium]